MSESPQECRSRLEMMASGDPKWDLSDNDVFAIQYMLNEMSRLTARIEGGEGSLVPMTEYDRMKQQKEEILSRQSLEIRRQVAEECANLAASLADSYVKTNGFPSEHAVGAETVAVVIRKHFGITKGRPSVAFTFDDRSRVTVEEARARGLNSPCIHSWRTEVVSGKPMKVCPFCGSEREL